MQLASSVKLNTIIPKLTCRAGLLRPVTLALLSGKGANHRATLPGKSGVTLIYFRMAS